jgi:hypothetical protein
MVLKFKGLITKLENSNDQIENSHLNWENIAVSEKNYSLPSSSETVSAVKALKLFQLWGTSHGYYPSPHDACRYHRMAFSGLIKARETPRTGSGDEKKRQERREKKKQRTEGTTGEANETETREENKRPAYPSFAFVFRTQTQ